MVKNIMGLAPGVMTTLSAGDRYSARCRDLCCYALPHLRQSRRRSVVRVAVREGVAAGLDDVRRRIEVGLADLQMDHVHPLGLQPSSLCQHLEGGLGTQATHPFGQLHHLAVLLVVLSYETSIPTGAKGVPRPFR